MAAASLFHWFQMRKVVSLQKCVVLVTQNLFSADWWKILSTYNFHRTCLAWENLCPVPRPQTYCNKWPHYPSGLHLSQLIQSIITWLDCLKNDWYHWFQQLGLPGNSQLDWQSMQIYLRLSATKNKTKWSSKRQAITGMTWTNTELKNME